MHAHHDAPTRRDAAGPSARRRLALASGPRADRPARCAAHHARRTLCAIRFARRPFRNITRRLLITRAHTTQPQRPASRDAADSPAHRRLTLASGSRAHRTAQCVAHNAHNTLRATLRAQHIARFRSPPRTRATTPRRRGATQRAAQPAAASRSPSAHAPTAPHPAQHAAHAALCAPRFARNTVRASLHTHAPDRTVAAPHGARAHYARNTLCAVRFATDSTAPLRAVCSSLAHTLCHEHPDAPRAVGPGPPSPRIRFRIARRSHRAARNPPRTQHMACLPHTNAHPALAKRPSQRSPSATQPKRPDAPRHGGPLSPPPSRAHLRLARQPRRPARSTPTRHTLCAFRFATDRTATLRAVRSSHAHTHNRNAAPTATQRAPKPAAASHPLRARAPAAPHSAQHLRTHTLRPTLAHGTLSAIRSPLTRTRNHNAQARRDAAGLSARRRLALASGSRADRTAPCATHFARNTLRATLRTHHFARFAPHTHTGPHRTVRNTPTRNTLRAVRFARRPYRNIARRLLVTRAHAQPRALRRAAT